MNGKQLYKSILKHAQVEDFALSSQIVGRRIGVRGKLWRRSADGRPLILLRGHVFAVWGRRFRVIRLLRLLLLLPLLMLLMVSIKVSLLSARMRTHVVELSLGLLHILILLKLLRLRRLLRPRRLRHGKWRSAPGDGNSAPLRIKRGRGRRR